MPERDRKGKFDRVLTEEQVTAIAVGLIAGKSQVVIAKELGLPRSSVGDVARHPDTKRLVSEEKAKASTKASARRAEIVRRHAAGLPPLEDEEPRHTADGKILGLISLPTHIDPSPPFVIAGTRMGERSGVPRAYADEYEYARVPREQPMQMPTLRCEKFSRQFDPAEPVDVGNCISLAEDFYPRMNLDRLRDVLEAAKPGEVIQLPELPT